MKARTDPADLIDIADLADIAQVTPTWIRQILHEFEVPRPLPGKAHRRLALRAICIKANAEFVAKRMGERIDQLEAENATLRRAAARG